MNHNKTAIAVLIATLGVVPAGLAFAETANTNTQAPVAVTAESLKAEMNKTPLDTASVQSMATAFLTENPSQAGDIFASTPAAAFDAVAKGAKAAADALKTANPDAYAVLQNAILNASPEFQAAYLKVTGDEDTTATGAVGNNAPTNTISGGVGGGGGASAN
jgi:hypothetical protein